MNPPIMNDKNAEKILLSVYDTFGKTSAAYTLREFVCPSRGIQKPGLRLSISTIEKYFPDERYVKNRINQIKNEGKKENEDEIKTIDL